MRKWGGKKLELAGGSLFLDKRRFEIDRTVGIKNFHSPTNDSPNPI